MSWLLSIPFDLIELVHKVMVGAIDVATNAIETPTEVAIHYQAHFFVDVENHTHLQTVAHYLENIARANALSAGAEIIRKELGL
jgi:5-methyltetrahydropteroyltriglutamate--homocysteine methyltransferase